jgi:hypothetical protein
MERLLQWILDLRRVGQPLPRPELPRWRSAHAATYPIRSDA